MPQLRSTGGIDRGDPRSQQKTEGGVVGALSALAGRCRCRLGRSHWNSVFERPRFQIALEGVGSGREIGATTSPPLRMKWSESYPPFRWKSRTRRDAVSDLLGPAWRPTERIAPSVVFHARLYHPASALDRL